MKLSFAKIYATILIAIPLSGCIILPIPPAISGTLLASETIAYASTKKPYYNPSYIVTEECAKDVMRTLFVDLGKFPKNEEILEAVPKIQELMTSLIHTPPPEGMAFNFNTNVEKGEFTYMLSSKEKHLTLLLTLYENNKGDIKNTIGGLKETLLENCEINE